MPIFQDDLDHPTGPVLPQPEPLIVNPHASTLRRLSEESLRTELCEGPVPNTPPRTPNGRHDDGGTTTSRGELIERLKRGESPNWVPTRHLDSFLNRGDRDHRRNRPSRTPSDSPVLPPRVFIASEDSEATGHCDPRLQEGLGIERPRSALHTGDFTSNDAERLKKHDHNGSHLPNIQPQAESPWIITSPPRDFPSFDFDQRRNCLGGRSGGYRPFDTSPLSASPSFSSSFAYKPPTSPLVQSESNEEAEMSEDFGGLDIPSLHNGSRRHTFVTSHSPPLLSPSYQSSFSATRPAFHRRNGSLPAQAHQPRRLSYSAQHSLRPGMSPQPTAMMRSRRMSFGSDSSPLHHASMVGSYEESILRGRMSTTPSKPLEFLAQIGVLGMGNCKPSLRCPSHVTLPFAAVYYSYSSTPHGRSRSDDGPSPYVGQIDLENGLPNQSENVRSKQRAHNRLADHGSAARDGDNRVGGRGAEREARKGSKALRGSGPPRAPPGGSYRIPEKGQLQIIIKNQNKTAVKLFLVPYDLAGMESGTKTFIRQRCYSAGPILDGIPKATKVDTADRPTLRYLIHIHICCPSRGRHYLYKSIRVVFANRVPDGKEKLKSETTMPEPRFTPYKPFRVMHSQPHTSGPGAALVADKAFRRRSSGFPMPTSSQSYDMMDDVCHSGRNGAPSATPSLAFSNRNLQAMDPIPLRLPPRKRLDSAASVMTDINTPDMMSPVSSQASRPSPNDPWAAPGSGDTTHYAKLNKGDIGYGGFQNHQHVPGSPGAEGLLTQRLRSIGVNSPSEEVSPFGVE